MVLCHFSRVLPIKHPEKVQSHVPFVIVVTLKNNFRHKPPPPFCMQKGRGFNYWILQYMHNQCMVWGLYRPMVFLLCVEVNAMSQ
jgi:hypothetical protein